MIDITQALRDAFNPNNGSGGRYIDYRLVWGITNEEARANAAVSSNEDASISRAAQIADNNGEPLNIATFEGDGFPLHGSAIVPPTPLELPFAQIGLILSDLSDADGTFAAAQIITIALPYQYNWIALTLDFGLSPAADFTITYYSGETEIRVTEVAGNASETYTDDYGADDCDKVIITITKLVRPHAHARLAEIYFGEVRSYSKSNSSGMEITEQIDPLNETIPTNELKISIDNFAAEYNIFDPAGIYAYLIAGQQLAPSIGAQQADGTIGYIDMGNYYYSGVGLKDNFKRLDISSVGLMGVLQNTKYTKGSYKTATLAEWCDDIAGDLGISVSYPDSFAMTSMTAYMPSVSHAEAFRRIAQATNTLLFVSRSNAVTFRAFETATAITFTPYDYNQESGIEPSTDEIKNTIRAAAMEIDVAASAVQLAKASGAGVHKLTYDLSTEQTVIVSGGSLISSAFYADNAVIEITAGTATVSGKQLTISTRPVTASSAQGNEAQTVYSVTENPFVQPSNAAAVAAHYLALKSARCRKMKMQYRGYPYIEMGDCALWQAAGQAFAIRKNGLKLAGGMTGTLEAREM